MSSALCKGSKVVLGGNLLCFCRTTGRHLQAVPLTSAPLYRPFLPVAGVLLPGVICCVRSCRHAWLQCTALPLVLLWSAGPLWSWLRTAGGFVVCCSTVTACTVLPFLGPASPSCVASHAQRFARCLRGASNQEASRAGRPVLPGAEVPYVD